MASALETVMNFVELSTSVDKPAPLLDSFAETVGRFGFTHFIMTGLPSYGEDVEDLIVADRWPAGWRDHYRENHYFVADPVSLMSFTRSKPFTWREARASVPETSLTLAIEAEACSFGLVDGVGFPLFDPQNWQAVVSLGSDKDLDLPQREISLVYLASVYCQMRAVELAPRIKRPVEKLSRREREVLTWLAAGKTYWETAHILSISESTVHVHLRNARAKLRASNTTQAVARAMLSRQIQV